MNDYTIRFILIAFCTLASAVVNGGAPGVDGKSFSREFNLNPELGVGALFSTTDIPAVPKFANARESYNFFTPEFADDLTGWLITVPSGAVITLAKDVGTPFGIKAVSRVQMNNASKVLLMKSYSTSEMSLMDLINRDIEYSIWLYNKKAIPSRISLELKNRAPINGSDATLCVIPPQQWVRCSGRMRTGSINAYNLEFGIKERQFSPSDGDIDLYASNASLIDLTDQISRGLISKNATTENVEPKTSYASVNANDYNLPVISIGDSIYAAPANGVANQQAYSTALGIENLGGFIDARAVGGWSVSDMYDDLVVTDPLTMEEKINSLPIISPGSNDALGDMSKVPVQKGIVDKIVQIFTDSGNNNYLILGVHGNSETRHDLDTAAAYNALLAENYGDRFLNTWQKLIEISDPVDQLKGVISQRYRAHGGGLHLSEEGKMHIVKWSIERLKLLGYPKRDGSRIADKISYQHTINNSLSYPLNDFNEGEFTLVIKWSPAKSQVDLSGDNGVLSVNSSVDSLVYVNSSGIFSKGSADPLYIDPSFEAGKPYVLVVRGKKGGGYQLGVKSTNWQWSVMKPFESFVTDSFMRIGLSTEMTQNFESIEIYKKRKSTSWIESNY